MKIWTLPLLVCSFATAIQAQDVPRAHRTPEGLSPEIAELWERSVSAEEAQAYLEAAELGEQILAAHPDQVHVRWRTARDWMRAAEAFVVDDPDRAIEMVRQARTHALAGRELDPACGECCFYDFAAVAREVATAGLMSSLFLVRDVKPVLDECLENPATWRDSERQSEEAALYYGAAQFFRLSPDSTVVEWVIGFRGDSGEALRWARKADAVSPDRINLRTELGTALLCHADRENDAALRGEGIAVLTGMDELAEQDPTDALDRERAAWLAENPEEACRAGRNINLD